MTKIKTVPIKSGHNQEMTSATVGMDDDDDEELKQADDNDMSASEDEGGSDEERKRSKLLEAISALGGRKRKKLGERSEASVQVSEFTVNAEGEGDKINLSDLIGTMDKTPVAFKKAKKQLRNLQRSQKTLETPLSKKETEKIQREVAFEKTSNEVSRWQSVVVQHQRAEQLVFPLDQEPSGPKPMERLMSGWKAQTPLEQEIFSILHMNQQPTHDPKLTPTEEASLKAMSLGEAKIRRCELQKARVLQSYYESKARRERKIKSKKFHKVQKKVMRKDYLKQFEDMCQSDPVAALEELRKMEMSRMQERMSLKHQNSGKWARSKAIMAKYDDGARKAMQQQLELNKDLTQKLVVPVEEEEEEEDAEVLPDFVNDQEPVLDPVNPWMRGKLSTEPKEQEASSSTEPPLEGPEELANPGGGPDDQGEEEEQMEEPEEEVLLREFEAKRKLRQAELVAVATMPPEGSGETTDANKEEAEEAKVVEISDDDDDDDDDEEDDEVEETALSEFTSVFQGIARSHQEAPKAGAEGGQEESPALLDEGLVRLRTLEDVEMLSQGVTVDDAAAPVSSQTPPTEKPLPPPPVARPADKNLKRKNVIDPNEVLTKEAKVIAVPLVPTAVDEDEDEEEQRVIIKEAFAGDDVVSDFLKDKRKQEDAGKPKAVDLTLPGWGEWGGGGLQPSHSKRRRFRVKVAPPPPRRDQRLPSVIISETRDSSIAAHQVSQLPFPFENPTQFERSIRSPVGRTWNTPNTVQKMTAPRVVTQLGAIIEPMAREALDKDARQERAGGLKITAESDAGQKKRPPHRRSQTKKKHKPKK